MNTRRKFLITAPLGLAGLAASAARMRRRLPGATTGSAADVRHGSRRRTARFGLHVCRSRKARAGDDDRSRARHGGGAWRLSMAPLLERRAGPRKVALEPRRRAGDALESGARAASAGPGARRLRAQHRRARSAARRRRRHRLCAGHAALTLDRAEVLTSERLTNIYLRPDRAIRSEAALRSSRSTKDAALAQAKQGRRGDRRRQVSRSAARHPVRRQGSARHRRHPHDLWRGAVPEPRARRPTRRSCAGSTTPAPC